MRFSFKCGSTSVEWISSCLRLCRSSDLDSPTPRRFDIPHGLRRERVRSSTNGTTRRLKLERQGAEPYFRPNHLALTFSEAQFVKTAALQCPLRFVASVPYIVGTLGLIAWGYVAHGSFNEQRLDMRWHGLSQTLSVPPSDLGRCRFVPTQRPFLRSTTTA